MSICIIPARGGSKRIPGKNVRPFMGKPMIAWSIEAAKRSGCFERVVVTTDSAEIAEVAREYGAEVPFMRPAELSDDFAGTLEVIAHAVEQLAVPDKEAVCCLYATAPFVRAEDLLSGEKTLLAADFRYVVSVTEFPYPIQRALKLHGGGIEMFNPDCYQQRSQDLEPAWHDCGQFYWGWAKSWLSGEPILSSGSGAVMLPRYRVVDIDTPEDWQRAEVQFEVLQNMSKSTL